MRRRRGDGTVCKRKDGRFEAAAYVNTPKGVRRVRRYAATRTEAEAVLVGLRIKNRNGLLTNTREQKLGDYLDYWLLSSKNRLALSTYLSYESTLRIYLKPTLGQKSLIKLKVSDIQLHFDNQLILGISVRNIQKQRIVLSAALKKAEQEELIIRNVARLVQIPQYHPKEIVPWSLEQLRVFLDHASSDSLYPVFMFLSLYGLRTSEALGLSWSDIDLNKKVIHVRQQLQFHDKKYYYAELKTQAGRRELPLTTTIYKILANIAHTNAGPLPDLIFKTRNDTPIHRRNLLRSFYRISKKASLPKSTLHNLRHSAATNLKDIGIPDRDTQLLLGHANISTTQQIYQHAGLEQRHLIIQQYEQKLVGISACSRQIKPSSNENEEVTDEINIGSGEWT